MKNIIVALDFRENSGLLIDQAASIAKAFNAKIWLIHTANDDPKFIGFKVGPQYIRNLKAEELREEHSMLQKLSDELNKGGITSEGLLISGKAVEAILDEAKQLKADLIVVGHHSQSLLSQALMGDTSSEIIRKSGIPLLVVPIISG